jgi:hypothetical protein
MDFSEMLVTFLCFSAGIGFIAFMHKVEADLYASIQERYKGKCFSLGIPYHAPKLSFIQKVWFWKWN